MTLIPRQNSALYFLGVGGIKPSAVVQNGLPSILSPKNGDDHLTDAHYHVTL